MLVHLACCYYVHLSVGEQNQWSTVFNTAVTIGGNSLRVPLADKRDKVRRGPTRQSALGTLTTSPTTPRRGFGVPQHSGAASLWPLRNYVQRGGSWPGQPSPTHACQAPLLTPTCPPVGRPSTKSSKAGISSTARTQPPRRVLRLLSARRACEHPRCGQSFVV